MLSHLLSTKLYTPPHRSNLISRPRLLEKLNHGLSQNRRLTLVSAPAGYGKSVLAAEWLRDIESSGQPASASTWFSVDANDNDPNRFIQYLVAALQKLNPGIGQSLLSMLSGAQLPPVESLMTSLINDLAETDPRLTAVQGHNGSSSGRLILALDDYHKISLDYIHQALQFLLDHQPAHFHLVIISREDPPLTLPKLRVQAEMTEIRAQDLRFTSEEISHFFKSALDLHLAPKWLQSLEARTEGWIAGLQLAALSLRSQEDVAAFLEDFSGSHRYLIDYLMDEVLRQQSEEMRQFLYQTSILERFNASLCCAVTGRPDSRAFLTQIDQSNLFIIPIDERREWYRYHHLFGDFLRLGLDPQSAPALHTRAAEWFEANGFLSEAIEHILAGRDYDHAAQLIARAAQVTISLGGLDTFMRWLRALPAETVQSNSDLLSLATWCHYFTGSIEEARRGMAALDRFSPDQMSAASQARLLSLKAWNSDAREEEETVSLAEKSLALTGDSDLLLKTSTLIVLGHGHRRRGELDQVVNAYRQAIRLGLQGHIYLVVVNSLNSLIRILNEQAKRQEAGSLTQEVLETLVDHRGRHLPVTDLLGISQSLLAYEANELLQAVEFAKRGREASRRFLSDRIMGGDAEWILIRSYSALGNIPAARAVIEEVRGQSDHLNWVLPLMDVLEAEIFLKENDLEAAQAWAAKYGFSPADTLRTARELFHIVYVRLLLALDRPQEAFHLLDQLQRGMEKNDRTLILISALLLRSLAESAVGNRLTAFQLLDRALRLAAPGGYLRRFLDLGPNLGLLLKEYWTPARAQAASPELLAFVEQLCRLFSLGYSQTETSLAVGAVPPPDDPRRAGSVQAPAQDWIEPLSEQEKKVLRLVLAGRSNQEIAEELVITLGTAKWHVHNILGKLGVSSRTQAIAKAQEMKML